MKNVLITGCSRGLGSIITNELLMRQYNVIPHFRKEGSYIDLKKTPIVVLGDINNHSTRDNIEDCLKKNDVSVYINNAAIHQRKSFLDHTEEEIESIISTNLTSQILIIQRVYKWFLERGAGLIVNINSIAGENPSPEETIYSASKYGLKGFSQSLQVESINSNIKIIDIFSGAMMTDMTINREKEGKLIDPKEVSDIVCNLVESKNTTSLITEIVVRKFVSRSWENS